jgi:diadenosine tetraphosphatase ApaH/serine/threonine PP2A family protein phosphatase
VRGNHDELVTHKKNPEAFSRDAQAALSFARNQLSPAQLNYLRRLPLTYMDEAFTLVHSTLDGPENWAYISTQLEAQTSFFYQKTHLCFIGHTHRPAAFLKEREVRPIEFRKVDVHPERLKTARKFMFNVGSVGQPRDGDWRASYALYDSKEQTVDLRRVGYEVEKAASKIVKAGLPDSLSARLFQGE